MREGAIDSAAGAPLAFEEARDRYRAIFDRAPVGMAEVETTTGKILQVNDRLCAVLGRARDELTMAASWREIMHPDDVGSDLEATARMVRTLATVSQDKRYLRPDGSVLFARVNLTPLWRTGEAPTRHLAIVEDQSAEHEARATLATKDAELQTVSRALHLHHRVRAAILAASTDGRAAREQLSRRSRERPHHAIDRLEKIEAARRRTGPVERADLEVGVSPGLGLELGPRREKSDLERRAGADRELHGAASVAGDTVREGLGDDAKKRARRRLVVRLDVLDQQVRARELHEAARVRAAHRRHEDADDVLLRVERSIAGERRERVA